MDGGYFTKLYYPAKNVTVDEQLVAFRGRCPFKQYIPSKPAKYGIKIWTLCDSKTSYVWKLQIYIGKDPGQKAEKIRICKLCDLSNELRGHNILYVIISLLHITWDSCF